MQIEMALQNVDEGRPTNIGKSCPRKGLMRGISKDNKPKFLEFEDKHELIGPWRHNCSI